MSEAQEKARALLAATAGVRLTAQRGGGPLTHGIAVDVHGASLFMEADERIPIGSLQAIAAAPGLLEALCDENDALGAELAQEAAMRAELTAEVKRLKAANAVLGARVAIVCECVKSRQGPMGGSIARPLPGCDECGGTGGIIVDGDA